MPRLSCNCDHIKTKFGYKRVSILNFMDIDVNQQSVICNPLSKSVTLVGISVKIQGCAISKLRSIKAPRGDVCLSYREPICQKPADQNASLSP